MDGTASRLLDTKSGEHYVTEGSRGIGKAIHIELDKEGCDVVIAYRTQSTLEETAKEIEDLTGRRIIAAALDATFREQVDSTMAEGVQQLGGLDILVNRELCQTVPVLRLGQSTDSTRVLCLAISI